MVLNTNKTIWTSKIHWERTEVPYSVRHREKYHYTTATVLHILVRFDFSFLGALKLMCVWCLLHLYCCNVLWHNSKPKEELKEIYSKRWVHALPPSTLYSICYLCSCSAPISFLQHLQKLIIISLFQISIFNLQHIYVLI